MIVDNPINYGLVVGQQRLIPEVDDARLQVPSIIMPIVGALQTTNVVLLAQAAVEQSQSCLLSNVVSRAPSSAQQDTTVLTLAKGLWELEFEQIAHLDYGGTPGALVRVQTMLQYQGQQTAVLTFMVGTGGGVGSAYNRFRFLFNSVASVFMRTPATGVAQNVAHQLTMNAIKIL